MKIVVVYQSLLGIYGDQGNSRVLAQRLRWRGLNAEVVFAEPGNPLTFILFRKPTQDGGETYPE